MLGASILDDMLLESEENMVLGCYHECIKKYIKKRGWGIPITKKLVIRNG
jgi:hypothetical protein